MIDILNQYKMCNDTNEGSGVFFLLIRLIKM